MWSRKAGNCTIPQRQLIPSWNKWPTACAADVGPNLGMTWPQSNSFLGTLAITRKDPSQAEGSCNPPKDADKPKRRSKSTVQCYRNRNKDALRMSFPRTCCPVSTSRCLCARSLIIEAASAKKGVKVSGQNHIRDARKTAQPGCPRSS